VKEKKSGIFSFGSWELGWAQGKRSYTGTRRRVHSLGAAARCVGEGCPGSRWLLWHLDARRTCYITKLAVVLWCYQCIVAPSNLDRRPAALFVVANYWCPIAHLPPQNLRQQNSVSSLISVARSCSGRGQSTARLSRVQRAVRGPRYVS